MKNPNDLVIPNIAPHVTRRAHLAERIAASGGGVVIVPTAPEHYRNRDNSFPYRFDSYFHYLTGFTEPESVLVMIVGETTRSILFCRPKNLEREIWDGFRHGPEAARDTFGVDETFSIETLATQLPELISNQNALWYSMGHDDTWDKTIVEALRTVRAGVRTGMRAPTDIRDVRAILDEMRLFKDEFELDIMRRAGKISARAHRRAMLAAHPGNFEYEVEAELLHEFRRSGSQYPAYNSIVASGPNACVLHYNENSRRMQDGDLLLIDAGCELDGYAADITRTFPINGRFSKAQQAVYEIVLASQEAAFAKCRPGTPYDDTHQAALRVLAQGMIDLGLLQGSLDEVLESGSYRQFYMHRTGHWLGMDVHDAGDYKVCGAWRPLRPGMVVTIEPGFYVRPAENVPEAYWNIGVRIEDNILITYDGHENLTSDAPKTVAEIEAVMAETHGQQ